MKIAVCLNGEPRSILQGAEYIKKYFNDLDVDYFCQAWTNSTVLTPTYTKLNEYDEREKKLYKDIPKIKEYLSHIYKPKATLVEEFTQERVFGQFLAAEKVLNLKKEYETKNNFKYDIVIRLRYDTAIVDVDVAAKKSFFSEKIGEVIYINNIRVDTQDKVLYAAISDHGPWIGNSKIMDLYHDNIFNILKEWHENWKIYKKPIQDRKLFTDILYPPATLTPEASWAILFGVNGVTPKKYKPGIFRHNTIRTGTPIGSNITDVTNYHVYRDVIRLCEEWNLFTEDRPLLPEEQFKINQPEGVYYQIYMKIQDIVNNALDVDKKLGTVFLDKEISLVI